MKERPRNDEDWSKNGSFGFGRAKNGTRVEKWKRGEGEGKEGVCQQAFPSFLPQPLPLFYLPHFSSCLWLSFRVLCSETERNRLLRRLESLLWTWQWTRRYAQTIINQARKWVNCFILLCFAISYHFGAIVMGNVYYREGVCECSIPRSLEVPIWWKA